MAHVQIPTTIENNEDTTQIISEEERCILLKFFPELQIFKKDPVLVQIKTFLFKAEIDKSLLSNIIKYLNSKKFDKHALEFIEAEITGAKIIVSQHKCQNLFDLLDQSNQYKRSFKTNINGIVS